MAKHTIPSSQLTPGAFINVRGTVEFSRLTRFLTDKEMDEQRRRSPSSFFPTKPFTTITVNNAQIVPQNPNGQLSKEEIYVQETFFTSANKPGMNYGIQNKSPNFPRFYQVRVNPDGSIDNTHVDEVPAKGELAKGLDVILVLHVFKPKNYANCGIGLEAVIAQEKIRYYEGGGALQHLANMGVTVTELSQEERQATQAAQTQTATASAAPAPQPVPAPVGDPFSSAAQNNAAPTPTYPQNAGMPAGMPAPAAPVSAPTPAPVQTAAPASDTWKCPNCGHDNTGKFCNECATPRPVQTAAPAQQGTPAGNGNPYTSDAVLGQTRTGIRFDPNDNNRNY